MASKPKIFIFISFYLPGYKAGGPLRSIANMVDHLHDDFEFWIVTRDRDLGDISPYPDIQPNQWQQVGAAMVYYVPSGNFTLNGMANLIADTPYDVLYLNSFFEPVFTLKPLLLQFLGKLPEIPIVLAPRGEFSAGALKLKRYKKMAYILLSRLLGLRKNIMWQASSGHEAEDIRRTLHVSNKQIIIAPDLPSKTVQQPSMDVGEKNAMTDGQGVLRIVFLSRVSPMKNLDYALQVLSFVSAEVFFDIYGPIEDIQYWQGCLDLMRKLPANIHVNYCGVVMPMEVRATFAKYDLFLFPTRGENYGHVIAESLSAGTRVLISDQTPWRNLTTDGLGWDLSLEDIGSFVEVIEDLQLANDEERKKIHNLVGARALERLIDPAVVEANRQLFFRRLSL